MALMQQKELERLLGQVRWIQKNVQFVRRNPKDYARLFGHKKLGTVVRTRQVGYMNSCFDLTAMLALRLKKQVFMSPQWLCKSLSKSILDSLLFISHWKFVSAMRFILLILKQEKPLLFTKGVFLQKNPGALSAIWQLQRFQLKNLE